MSHPFTGFGDDLGDSVKFDVLAGNDSRVQMWVSESRIVGMPIANSNRTVYMKTGRGDWKIQLRLAFASVDDMDALDALIGTTATLRYPWGVTNKAGGVYKRLGDSDDYLVLSGVLLLNLSDKSVEAGGNYAEASATFARQYGGGA